jgi:hypothetical protein
VAGRRFLACSSRESPTPAPPGGMRRLSCAARGPVDDSDQSRLQTARGLVLRVRVTRPVSRRRRRCR